MNCFEARSEFAAFWRRTISPAERMRLVEHLTACAQCDRSFRVFALSAPVVHLEHQPEVTAAAARPPLNLVRPHRFASVPIGATARRNAEPSWRIGVAAAALLMIGGFAAWSSTQGPAENFAESVVADSPEVEVTGYSFDNAASAIDASAQEPALFDAIAPESSTPGGNGRAG